MADEGASNKEILESENYDIHFTDGAGNTAAHLAAKYGSLGCLEYLVNLDDIDLNIKNRLEGNTPLHYAVEFQNKDEEVSLFMVDILLQGGSDVKIENRNKMTPAMLVNPNNNELKKLFTQASAACEVDDADIANDDEYGSDDDQPSD
ncbi:unnamed protein product [Cunninghamella echinulata]